MFTAIILDDERRARRELKRLLEEGHREQIQVVGEAATLRAAASLVRLHDPDLVFLDIHLTGESGFELLPLLDSSVTVVVVSAFDSYAMRAFEVNALDYLLKPVAPRRLASTLARLRRPASADTAEPAALEYGDRLFLKLDDRMAFVRVRDIVALHAAGDNSVIHLAGGRRARTRKSLREWVDRLPERDFVRIHRSTVVNLGFVERLEEWSHLSYRVYLHGLDEPLQMSRRWGARLRSRLG